MNLERIEITGFKSFADKTIIAFDKGVTAVVGPNGSGKSNLSEAIKWVLGEQSAKSLRGKKMDDIIFSGSQTRKPTNVAEVTLVLNNEDHFLPLETAEIQITRRFHRNGESENFINKKPCRLKDIVNLLMDSGLGKDSFSIISQGKVETIFNNKPEERRAMFEEVAGVLKYKTRKQEASRKLDKTQEHLNRVEDILHEIEGQLKPLASQKEKALIYQEKKGQLSQIDIALLVSEIEAVNEQYHFAKQELQQLTTRLSEQQVDSQTIEQSVQQLYAKLSDLEQILLTKQQQFVQLVQTYERIDGQYNVLSERLQFSKQNKRQQDEARFHKEQLVTELTQSIHTLQTELQQKKEQLFDVQKLLEEVQQEAMFLEEGSKERIEEERQSYIEYLQEQTRLNNVIVAHDKDMTTLQVQVGKWQTGIDEHEKQLIEQSELLSSLRVNWQNAQATVEQLMTTYQSIESELQQLKVNRHQVEEQVLQSQTDLSRLEARYASLRDLTDDYAGFYQGVKEILKQKQKIGGIHGAVAELLSVPTSYTTAIDIALGASAQHVVVSDDKSAMQAIRYLKERQLGRATFLPLSVIKERILPVDVVQRLQKEKGYVGIANQLVSHDSQYQVIFANLLGQTIVAQDMSSGSELAKKIQYRYRIVTLDGEVIHAGGSMTGGATKQQKTASLLSRKNELDSLRVIIAKDKDSLQVYRQQLAQLIHDEERKQAELKTIQQEGTQSRLKETELANKVQQLEDKLTQLQSQQQLWQVELATGQQQLKGLVQEKTNLTLKLSEIDGHVSKIKQHIDTLNSSQEDKARQLAQMRLVIQEHSTQAAVLNEQVMTLSEQLKQAQAQLKDTQSSLKALQDTQEEHLQSRDELLAELDQLKIEKEQTQSEKDALEQMLQMLREEKKALETELFLEETRRNDIQQVVQKLLKDSGTLEAKIGRFEVTIDTHLARLSEEYELTFEAAKPLVNVNVTIQEASRQVAQLKREIDDLGLINLAAIEEYDAVYDRFTFMSEQQADLLQAKEGLLSTMFEMDQEMSRRFHDTFFAIKQQFEKTFPKLFGGGRASLELTNPDNLLETGIEIIAQPPGKRLQNLSLLSGGEKAFTAIALLFAILEVKPVPFCLLDEVEAALDEANVGRYGRYLKEFVEKTQFIVITHRKGTMEEADILYGVTMQESGVSKLASVRFEDYV